MLTLLAHSFMTATRTHPLGEAEAEPPVRESRPVKGWRAFLRRYL